jgi:uncharacterized SAM-binding protein YcdF (DUF218 family)
MKENKMKNRKPRVYGAREIRIILPGGRTEWFYDVFEAVEFVNANWQHGKELSARVNTGGSWEPVYIITEDGEAYMSSLYAEILKSAPVKVARTA